MGTRDIPPAVAPDLFHAIDDAMRIAGVDLALVGRAWARATPLVVLVPAFGLRALPSPARVTLAIAFALVVYPALGAAAAPAAAGAALPIANGPLSLVAEVLRGLPIAIATAVPLWAATMTGGIADALRGQHDGSSFVSVEGRATPIAILFSLGACAAFLSLGGPARAALALVGPAPTNVWLSVMTNLAHGITLAVAVAGPMLAASIVLEVSGALVARAASPAHVEAIVAPAKTLVLLVVVALGLDRMVALFR